MEFYILKLDNLDGSQILRNQSPLKAEGFDEAGVIILQIFFFFKNLLEMAQPDYFAHQSMFSTGHKWEV